VNIGDLKELSVSDCKDCVRNEEIKETARMRLFLNNCDPAVWKLLSPSGDCVFRTRQVRMVDDLS